MSDSTLTRSSRVGDSWRWLEAALDGRPVPPLLIVIGLGDGSLLDALDERAPTTRVLALEPDPAAARTFFAHRRNSPWRTNGRLVYLADPGYAGADEAWKIFKQHDEPRVVVHPSVLKAPGNARATNVLTKILNGVKANAQARKRFAPRYLTNVLRNVPAILAGGDVRALTNVYRGMPAVVAAAGPSLDHAIPELHDVSRRALLIACDTALRPLLHGGLTPPLVVGADPGSANARHFQSLPDCPNTYLVAESALDPTAVAPFLGRTLWFRLAPHHPWPWLNALGIDVGLVDMWGSVLTAAFQVACLAGCDPIVIVGADLAHSGGRPYARTTTYELDWAHAVARGETPEETWRGHIAGSRPIERQDLRGVTTTTTPTMLAFKDWMIARAKRSGRRVINATGAGMLVGDGIEQGSINAALGRTHDLPPVPFSTSPSALARYGETSRKIEPIRWSEIAAKLRDVRSTVGVAASAGPVADWMAFTEGGLDDTSLAAALDDAASALESPRNVVPAATVLPFAKLFACEAARSVSKQLPESIERLKIGLRGEAPPPNDEDRGALLLRALDVLAAITEQLAQGTDLEHGADPERIGKSPASALYPWPEPLRWAVITFEALLGRAWQNAVPEAPIVFPDTAAPRHATRAGLVLAVEWLRCSASVDASHELRIIDAAGRLSSLARIARGVAEHPETVDNDVVQVEALSNEESATILLWLDNTAEVPVLRMAIEHTADGCGPRANVGDCGLRVAVSLPVLPIA